MVQYAAQQASSALYPEGQTVNVPAEGEEIEKSIKKRYSLWHKLTNQLYQ
jgi:hypothetical protein